MKSVLIVLMALLVIKYPAESAGARTASATIGGVIYKATLNGDESLSIRDGKKTVCYIKRADLYVTFEKFSGLEFKDFNGDGNPDLVIDYRSNVPGISDLLLYNKHTKKFVLINEFTNYPVSTRITNTPFYYSFHPSGCADMDWDSDLFKIVNYKIVPLGTLSGKGCTSSHEKLGIFIYKRFRKKQHLIKSLPINSLDTYQGNKQTFISKYWSSNYRRF